MKVVPFVALHRWRGARRGRSIEKAKHMSETKKQPKLNPNIATMQKSFVFADKTAVQSKTSTHGTTSYKPVQKKMVAALNPDMGKADVSALHATHKQEFSDAVKLGWDKIKDLVEVTSFRMGAKGRGGLSFKPIVARVAKVKMSDDDIVAYLAQHPELVARLKNVTPAKAAELPLPA